ncbi:hypothetical protein [Streptomyces sp. NPDC088785]|uniref:hypothetical protein n=1 Tax=Streptomyces sp. NPDC088785 TaxID=3365897 RepID=UPI0038084286
MRESKGRNGSTDTMERHERGRVPASGGSGRHRGAVTVSAAPSEQPEPRGRHRGARADEA